MKITIKTIKRDTVELDVEETTLIGDIKAQIQSQLGDAYPKEQQVLVFKGKQLQDATTVGDSNVSSDGFLVVTVVKKKVQPKQPEQEKEQKKDSVQSTIATKPEGTSQPQQGQGQQQSGQSQQSTLATGEKYEEVINQICGMGFDKEQVKQAMRLSFNNPDRAVEYLTTGFPENVQELQQQQSTQSQPASQQQRQPSSQTPTSQQRSQQQSPGPNAQPLNMFQPVGQQGAQGQGLEAFQGAGAGAGGPQLPGNIQLPQGSQEQQYQYINNLLQQNPAMLEQFIEDLAQRNPQMLQDLQQNQGDVARLLGGGMEPSEQTEGQGVVQLDLTQEDETQITQLESMGFDRRLCIEAYLACDKNYELAANYLLEHPQEF